MGSEGKCQRKKDDTPNITPGTSLINKVTQSSEPSIKQGHMFLVISVLAGETQEMESRDQGKECPGGAVKGPI